MALPTLTKTWQFNVDNAIAAQGSALADNRRILRSIKDALIGFATNPWTMRYSCNSVTAGTAGDTTDRLTTDANFVWASAGTAHSWFVLRQTGVATNFEVCISCESVSTNGVQLAIVISPSAGFTGGTTTARPTATDEFVVLSGTWTAQATDTASRWSVLQSTDGQCTRVWGAASGSINYVWILDKPANAVTGWSNPSCGWAFGATPTLNNFTAYNGKMRSGSTNGNVAMGCETAGNAIIPSDTVIGTVANEIDGTWMALPIGISCNTVGIRGRHGTMQDLWFSQSPIPTGDTYPDVTNQFVEVFPLILPWNGGPVHLV